jgi:uncharacterized protein (DUF433 family)
LREELIVAAVIDSMIERTPGVCGGDARIRGTRIPVWLLVAYRKDGASDKELLEMYPTLTLGDLSAAWWYYAEHHDEVEQSIREQEVAA